jgi:uncharacterized membrane protein HdeD (DUF308 family)
MTLILKNEQVTLYFAIVLIIIALFLLFNPGTSYWTVATVVIFIILGFDLVVMYAK